MQESVQEPEERPVEMWDLQMALPPFLPTPAHQGMGVTEDHDPYQCVSCSADKNLI
jgi:hypothetical protein